MKKSYAFYLFLIIVILCTPIIAAAHVKWFTKVTAEKEAIEQILSPMFMALTVFVALLLAVLTQILPLIDKWSVSKKIDGFLDQFRNFSRYLLKYGTAIALIIQVWSGTIFAPEFSITHSLVQIALWVTIISY